MTVYENMAFGLTLEKGHAKEEIRQRVEKAADMLQIRQYLDRLPKQLSGGQRQRVAIGRAITRDPKVFLFDEPLSNLDAALRVATRIEIAKLHEEMNQVTMIYVTHDQVEAMTLADRICVLRDGLVEQVGTPMELYERPDSIFVAGFIGSPKMNFIAGDKAEKYGCATLGIRGEHMDIKNDGLWEGTVIHTENLGADSYVYLDMGQEEPVVVRLDGAATYQSGTVLKVSPQDERIHRFDAAGKPIR
jgi:multiple sugar transport system ATP-binding protein